MCTLRPVLLPLSPITLRTLSFAPFKTFGKVPDNCMYASLVSEVAVVFGYNCKNFVFAALVRVKVKTPFESVEAFVISILFDASRFVGVSCIPELKGSMCQYLFELDFSLTNFLIGTPLSSVFATAVAPLPPPPEIDTVGAEVYPEPGF